MPILVPDLASFGCSYFTACGTLKAVDGAVDQILGRQRETMIVSHAAPSGQQWLRVLAYASEDQHLHIDLADRSYFTKEPPGNPSPFLDFENLMQRLAGKEIGTQSVAFFSVPISDLPATGLIRLLMTENKSDKVSIKMTAATLSFTGAPLSELEWSTESADKVRVRLAYDEDTVIDDSYLVRLLAKSRKLFDSQVLKKADDATPIRS
jgi:hypothetical protein